MDLLDSSSNSSKFQLRLRSIKSNICLQESEETWDTISAAIISLREACESNSYISSIDLIQDLRELQRPLVNAMSSERTRLSGAAVDLVAAAAKYLGMQFETLLSPFFPSLLHLCGRANKVVVTRARNSVFSIIETTQLSAVLPHLLQYSKDKAASLRLTVAECTLACLNCCNPPDLEKNSRIKEIEAIIRSSARDASADVRKAGKRIFEAYKILFPCRIDAFTIPLTPTIRKYLDLKASAATVVRQRAKQTTTDAKRSNTSLVPQSTTVNDTNARPLHRAAAQLPQTVVFQFNPKRPIQCNTVPTSNARAVGISQSSNPAAPHRKLTATSTSTSNNFVTMPRIIRPNLKKDGVEAANPRARNGTKMQITNVDSSGPRRIPLPETSKVREETPVENSHRESRNEVSRPISSAELSASSRNGPSRLNQTQRGKVGTTHSTLAASGLRAKLQEGPSNQTTNKTTRSLTQPTLSQLARVKRPTDRKTGALVSAKPLWGRPSTRREPMKVTPKKGTNSCIKSGMCNGNDTVNEPANIPLPSSPVLSEDALRENKRLEEPLDEPIIITTEKRASCVSPPGIRSDVVLDKNSPEAEERCPTAQEFQTPSPNMWSSKCNVADSKTPISALLESIEQGFEFTPSSPLSPPQPYLTRGSLAGMTATLNVPFHLTVSQARQKLTNGVDRKV